MRVIASALAALALCVSSAAGQSRGPTCPHDAALGAVTFTRGGLRHVVSLGDCRDRVTGKVEPPRASGPLRRNGHVAAVRLIRTGPKTTTQTILVDGRPVYTVHEDYRTIPGGTPGPIVLVDLSPDARWVFFAIDPMNSASIAADGLKLNALRVRDARVVPIGGTLVYDDYRSWCGSTLVLTFGGDRLATHGKRLVLARAPDWRLNPLWRDPSRAFGSVACAPGGRRVAVLSEPAGPPDYSFFHTRWQLWQAGLDGTRRLLDRPPPGWADESPHWSRDGRSLLFVRERNGYGRLMLWRGGTVTGPIANLGYSLGYYGHHDWAFTWSTGSR